MPEAGKSRQVKGRQKMCLCGAVNDKEGGASARRKSCSNDSKEKVWYELKAEEELNREETNQRTDNTFILCAELQNGICPKSSN